MINRKDYCPLGNIGGREYKLTRSDILKILSDNGLLKTSYHETVPSKKAIDEGYAIYFENKGKYSFRWHKKKTMELIKNTDLSFLLKRWIKRAKKSYKEVESCDDGSNLGFKMGCWQWEEFEESIPSAIKDEVLERIKLI